MIQNQNIRVFACCIAQHIRIRELLASDHYGEISRIRDAVILSVDHANAFIFDYGVIVFWDMENEQIDELRMQITHFADKPHMHPTEDELYYNVVSGKNELRVHNDLIETDLDSEMIRLSFSHALAQSVKLEEFENSVQKTIEKTQYIPEALAKDGKVPLGRKELSKERGKLFLTKANVHLQYGLLDTPEFFWEYPDLEPNYHSVIKYLEVRQRIEALNQKLEVIQELLDMLADEQKHKHSSLLEWIIIILIAVEIVLYFRH